MKWPSRYDTDRRIIGTRNSGFPSGTIRVRATNDGGTADWTVNYTTTSTAFEGDASTESWTFNIPSSTGTAALSTSSIIDTEITSTPSYDPDGTGTPDTYGFGDVIEFTVTYDTAVDVVGTPRFPMNFGQSPSGGPEYADYAGSAGSEAITFEWIVSATDLDTNGIFFYGNTDSQNRGEIDLNGGSIRRAGTTIDADLVTLNRGTKSGHKVDGSLVPAPTDFTGNAQSAEYTFVVPSSTGTSIASVSGDADASNWSFTVLGASGESTIADASGNAATANWSIGVPSATGESTVPDNSGNAVAATWNIEVAAAAGLAEYSGNASASSWDIDVTSAAGTTVAASNDGNAVAANWTFNVPSAVGGATAPSFEGNASSISWSFAVSSASGTAIAADYEGNADASNWSFNIPSASGTVDDAQDIPNIISTAGVISGTPTTAGSGVIRVRATNLSGSDDWTVDYTTVGLLSLNDLNTVGREFDVMALLESSADATPIPSDIYTDSDRGGTDSPLDGELGLGSSQTVISRIRRQINDGLATLTFNDNDNPTTLHIGNYFASGDGSDLNLTIQTTATNAVDLPHSAFGRGGSGFAHWRLTSEAQAIVDAIETGDRFIIALWRRAPITLASEFEATASFESTLHVTRHLTAEFSASATLIASLEPQISIGDSEFEATASFEAELTLSTPIQLVASFEASASFTANQPTSSTELTFYSRFGAQANFQAILTTDRMPVAQPTPGADIIHQLEIASAASVRSISDADDTASFIRIQNNGSLEWQSFIKFDLSGLPNLPIRFASLVLESSMNDGLHIGLFTELHEVSEAWTASGLTDWAGRPAVGDQYEQTSTYDDDAFILTSLAQEVGEKPIRELWLTSLSVV